ncbi:hypothetical protein ACFX5U_09475 [Sphingobacterium sp. SG20118]|uniref:hypothetical protein n=1 Tax=Sphingobacterium sp. SG20118 TaxID=3367156 RepID=UPI0037DFBF0E
MEDKINMETRIIKYNTQYGFIENPTAFSFNANPHRLIIRNYALRTKERNIYQRYLKDFHPEHEGEEIRNFDHDLIFIKHLDSHDMGLWLVENEVKILQSDIDFRDKDAIFTVKKIRDESVDIHLIDDDDFILNKVSPVELLKVHETFWIDTQIRVLL